VIEISPKFLIVCVLFTLFLTVSQRFQNLDSGREVAPALQTNTNLIQFGDLIDIDVVGSFEFDWRGTINPEGFLDGLDKIPNRIYALCRSETEIADAIAKEYGLLLRDPKVVVRILDRSNRAVAFLDGAVRFPQRFQIRRPVRLNEILVLAGGITDRSSGEIRIFQPQSLNCDPQKQPDTRSVSERPAQTNLVKISDMLAGTKDANPLISSGDIVTVTEADPVYLIGGVNVPKQIALRAETTLSRAIAMAGGVAKDGLEDKVRIFRRDPRGSKIIDANLKLIEANKAEDPVLQAYDVIDVEQKGRGPGKLPPLPDGRSANDRLSRLPLRIID